MRSPRHYRNLNDFNFLARQINDDDDDDDDDDDVSSLDTLLNLLNEFFGGFIKKWKNGIWKIEKWAD